MERITFIVPGEPVAKGRPRATTINGDARMYTPKKTANYEALVALAAQQAGCVPFQGPVKLTIAAYWSCPKSQQRKRDPRPQQWKVTKPDGDNLMKSIADGLIGIAYQDDSQAAEVTVRKYVAAQGEPARCEVTIEKL